jgi:hypothetical protein
MRFFKPNRNVNFKYIFGELLLLFIGINLAIWFNDWNSSKKINEGKNIAIEKITEEIENNKLEIDIVLKNSHKVLNAYKDFKNLYDGDTSIIIANPKHLQLLRNKYPGFFMTKDSIALDDGLYHYRGTTRIILEIATLTEIAWKTTTTLNLINEFNYECLYELESLYNQQRRIQIEIDKSADALQKGDLDKLMIIFDFINQLGDQLQDDYDSVKKSIINCN